MAAHLGSPRIVPEGRLGPRAGSPLRSPLVGSLLAAGVLLVSLAGAGAAAGTGTGGRAASGAGLALTAYPSYGVTPLTVRFEATAPNGTVPNVSWSFGDGTYRNGSAPGLLNVTHVYVATGTFEAVLTANSSDGATLDASLQIIVVADALAVGITASPAQGPAPLTLTLHGSATGGAVPYTAFNWSFGDGGAGVGPVVTYTFLSPGSFLTTLTVTDAAGHRAAASMPVAVGGTDLAVQVRASPAEGAAPLTVNLTAIASGGSLAYLSYAWTLGDASAAGGPAVRHTYLAPGRYLAGVRVTDTSGESVSGTALVLVEHGLLNVTSSAGSAVGTDPLAREFTASAVGGSGSYVEFRWTFGDGTAAVGSMIDHTFPHAGSFNVSVTVVDSWNETFTAAMAIRLTEPPSETAELLGGIGLGVAVGAIGIVLWVSRSYHRRTRFLAAEQSSAPGPMTAAPGPAIAASAEPSPGFHGPPSPSSVASPNGSGVRASASRRSALGALPSSGPPPGTLGALGQQRQLAFDVVGHLARTPRSPPSDPADVRATQAGIAAALGVGTSTVSKALRRLAAAGVVEGEITHVVGARRRVRAYRLTPKGERLAGALRADTPERP